MCPTREPGFRVEKLKQLQRARGFRLNGKQSLLSEPYNDAPGHKAHSAKDYVLIERWI